MMTWGEFKKLVDDALTEGGRDDSIEIEYIDFSWPDEYDKPEVFFDRKFDRMAIH